MKLPILLVSAIAFSAPVAFGPNVVDAAPSTVFCRSVQSKYTECRARFRSPVLVMQKSRVPCIINNSWGYNPATGNIWVARGCQGVFAEQSGFHHGRSGTMDVDARRYSNQGTFIGYGPAIVVQKNIVNNNVTIERHNETIIDSNHDIARITDPDTTQEIDSTPHFDRNGNPNFDTDGNYIGPHGVGALVDSPENDGGDDQPTDTTFDTDGNEDAACGGDDNPC